MKALFRPNVWHLWGRKRPPTRRRHSLPQAYFHAFVPKAHDQPSCGMCRLDMSSTKWGVELISFGVEALSTGGGGEGGIIWNRKRAGGEGEGAVSSFFGIRTTGRLRLPQQDPPLPVHGNDTLSLCGSRIATTCPTPQATGPSHKVHPSHLGLHPARAAAAHLE